MLRQTFRAAVVLWLLALPASGAPVFTASAAWRNAPPAPGAAAQLVVTVEVQPGWHINSNTPLEEFLIPTEVRLDLPPGWTADPPSFPPHRLASFAFSDGPVAVFEGSFAVNLLVHRGRDAAAQATLHGVVEAQACNDKMCLPPAEVGFSVASPAGVGAAASPGAGASAVPSTTDGPVSPPPIPSGSPTPASPAVAQPLQTFGGSERGGPPGLSKSFLEGGLLLQLAIVFLAGLALNLTPCVYPLIPITIGFFAAQTSDRRSRAWLLAAVYVLGMSVTYSVLGVTAALTGRLFGAALQSPWVVGAIVLVLLALAASMFGAWELRVPAWATRVSGGRSGVGGALVMGLAVGLVAAPCIGPFVLGLLTYVGQRQDPWLGFVLFFTLSLGLGLPYMILAVSTRALERLPNSGAWMVGVRQVFGVLLVALACYFLRPFLPSPWDGRLLPWSLVLGGAYLLIVARPGHDQPWIDRVMRLASAAILAAGLLTLARAHGAIGPGVAWQPYDERAVQAALDSGQPVVLDFFATWCAPCKELDEKTFPDPRVAAALARFARFKVDLTRSDAATDAIRGRFNVLGVPTVALFRDGREVGQARLTGFEPPEEFLARLQRVAGR
ncbi:MAG: cytochrome c biogenesis protein CcdA [Acidobacteriota bacterium]